MVGRVLAVGLVVGLATGLVASAGAAPAAPAPSLTAELRALGTAFVEADRNSQFLRAPCVPTPQDVARYEGRLARQVGAPVTIVQVCDTPNGALIGVSFRRGQSHIEQVVRVTEPSTIDVLASWQDMRNCDDGMCDHFSTVDALLIAHAADLDGDGVSDLVIDFATSRGDQGHGDHRLSLWRSKTGQRRALGEVSDDLVRVETFPDPRGAGIAVTTRTFDGDRVRACFAGGRATATCPAAIQATWARQARQLAIASEWANATDRTPPPAAATLARALTELGVAPDVASHLLALASP